VTAKKLRSLLAAFCNKRLIVLGDAMEDQYIWGKVSRISPEAPVPVVEVARETFVPGGAANVSRNIVSLGGHAELIAAVGADEMGGKLESLLAEDRVGTQHLIRHGRYPTTVKTRVMAHQQQVVRIDREDRSGLNSDVSVMALERVQRELSRADAVVLTDYHKGFLTQQLFDGAVRLATRARKIITVDPKPSHALRMRGMTGITPNRAEAYLADAAPADRPVEQVGQSLLRKWAAKNVLITLGEEGMALFQPDKKPFRIPTMAREVYDVSGAGDTVIAAFTLALAAGASAVEAAIIANHAAGVVVGKIGTATVSPEELVASFEAER
jgi:D-beta-D-heptose 7-phosphate kinase/D-beta-D-heptose 1-phosphate adenosyltransferase